jgi:hypothetical protein
MAMTLNNLLEMFVAQSLERQLALSKLLGKSRWQVETVLGWIEFNQKWRFPIQLLGAESYESNTWLWAWADERYIKHRQPQVMQAADQIRLYGQRNGIAEFVQPEIDLSVIEEGHLLALVCRGLIGADAYFRAQDEDRADFYLLQNTPLPKEDVPLKQMSTAIKQAVNIAPKLDPKAIVRAYLQCQGFMIEETNDEIRGVARDRREIITTFDRRGRLKSITNSE